MKRSRVNDILREAESFITSFGYVLPPFAYLSAQKMIEDRDAISNIVDRNLGWDVTDFGKGEFRQTGPVFVHGPERGCCRSRGRARHAVCGKDHDFAQGSALADASSLR